MGQTKPTQASDTDNPFKGRHRPLDKNSGTSLIRVGVVFATIGDVWMWLHLMWLQFEVVRFGALGAPQLGAPHRARIDNKRPRQDL